MRTTPVSALVDSVYFFVGLIQSLIFKCHSEENIGHMLQIFPIATMLVPMVFLDNYR